MSERYDLVMDQGADFALQCYWTSQDNIPFPVQPPMRMEIHDEVGSVAVTLQTEENSDEGTTLDEDSDVGITYNSESGLIQLYVSAEQTDAMGAGEFTYDLFVNYLDGSITGRVRKHRLLNGRVKVNGRTTRGF